MCQGERERKRERIGQDLMVSEELLVEGEIDVSFGADVFSFLWRIKVVYSRFCTSCVSTITADGKFFFFSFIHNFAKT